MCRLMFLIIWFIHNVQTDERTWFNETMIMTQEITIKYIFKFVIIWFIHNVQTDERTWFNETMIMTQ